MHSWCKCKGCFPPRGGGRQRGRLYPTEPEGRVLPPLQPADPAGRAGRGQRLPPARSRAVLPLPKGPAAPRRCRLPTLGVEMAARDGCHDISMNSTGITTEWMEWMHPTPSQSEEANHLKKKKWNTQSVLWFIKYFWSIYEVGLAGEEPWSRSACALSRAGVPATGHRARPSPAPRRGQPPAHVPRPGTAPHGGHASNGAWGPQSFSPTETSKPNIPHQAAACFPLVTKKDAFYGHQPEKWLKGAEDESGD